MRGIEIPAGAENQKYSGGFYISNSAVFKTGCPGRDWDAFLFFLSLQLTNNLPGLKVTGHYENVSGGRSAYVFAKDDRLKLIIDGQDKYIAVFLIADGSMTELVFNTALNALKNILVFGYRGSVYRRINYRKLEEVKDEQS